MKKKCVKKSVKSSQRILNLSQDGKYACVYLNKKKIRLGHYGSQEAEEKFRQLQIQVLSDPTLSFLIPQEEITVNLLCAGFLEYAKEHDSSHYSSIKTAIEILLKNFHGLPIESLDTRHVLTLQGKFVEHGVSRKYCNSLM